MTAHVEMAHMDGKRYFLLNGKSLKVDGLDVPLAPRFVRQLGVEPVRGDRYLLEGGNLLVRDTRGWSVTIKKLPLPEFVAGVKSFTYKGEIPV